MNTHPVPRPDAHSIAAQVAAVLGQPWTIDTLGEQFRDRGRLRTPDGVMLLFRIDARDRHLVQISGCYPPDPFHRSQEHLIRVAHARGAPVIAAQIVRRLLPIYLDELRLAQARTRAHAAQIRARTELLESIQFLLPGSSAPQGHGPSATTVSLTCPRPVTGSVRIDRCGTTATLELQALGTDLLQQILTLLGAAATGRSGGEPDASPPIGADITGR